MPTLSAKRIVEEMVEVNYQAKQLSFERNSTSDRGRVRALFMALDEDGEWDESIQVQRPQWTDDPEAEDANLRRKATAMRAVMLASVWNPAILESLPEGQAAFLLARVTELEAALGVSLTGKTVTEIGELCLLIKD